MGDILQNEIGNSYGKWSVIIRSESNVSSATWLCRCECGYERPILGVNLRRNKLPLCTNCCRVCSKTRAETEFKGNKRICCECDKKRIREWKKGNSEHRLKINDWLECNPEAVNRYRQNERNHIQKSPNNFLRFKFKDLIRKYRRIDVNLDKRAQEKSRFPKRYIVTITEDAVIAFWDSQNGCCAISGMPMFYEFNNPWTVSIDRIDSNLGYIPENVQLVCRWVNLAKNSFQDEDIRGVLREFKIL